MTKVTLSDHQPRRAQARAYSAVSEALSPSPQPTTKKSNSQLLDETLQLPIQTEISLTEINEDLIFELLSAPETENTTSKSYRWRLTNSILIIETKTCLFCSTSHKTSSGPFLEFRQKIAGRKITTTSSRLASRSELPQDKSFNELPRRVQHIQSTTDYCHLCFKPDYEGDSEGNIIQKRLFQEEPRKVIHFNGDKVSYTEQVSEHDTKAGRAVKPKSPQTRRSAPPTTRSISTITSLADF